MDFEHIPIMVDEVTKGLKIRDDGVYVDGTIGGGGHSLEIIKNIKTGMLIGIDQDEDALRKAKQVLSSYKDKLVLVHNNYENLDSILRDNKIKKIDGVLLDIGVSSYQLDKSSRGFSYNKNAKLDMRMDKTGTFTAWDIVNKYREKDLERIIWDYGEERWARRIAQFIVAERQASPIDTTFDLVDAIKKAIPKKVRMEGHHPAKKTFQAIRIEVNRELEVLENSIKKTVGLLKPGGRLAIITFHSLEDRIVKDSFRYLYKDCICPPQLPKCICEKTREIEIITRKPIVPSKDEIANNPRSRSAKLRIAEKL